MYNVVYMKSVFHELNFQFMLKFYYNSLNNNTIQEIKQLVLRYIQIWFQVEDVDNTDDLIYLLDTCKISVPFNI